MKPTPRIFSTIFGISNSTIAVLESAYFPIIVNSIFFSISKLSYE